MRKETPKRIKRSFAQAKIPGFIYIIWQTTSHKYNHAITEDNPKKRITGIRHFISMV